MYYIYDVKVLNMSKIMWLCITAETCLMMSQNEADFTPD